MSDFLGMARISVVFGKYVGATTLSISQFTIWMVIYDIALVFKIIGRFKGRGGVKLTV
jgi:ABC-type Na+ efflux pump permease subunit